MTIKKKYRVGDMHCSNCVMRLEALEDELPGIQQIKASYHRQMLEVEFDEQQIDEIVFLTAVRKAGYTPEVLD